MSEKLILLFFPLLSFLCFAQPDSLLFRTEETLEALIQESENEADYSDLYELIAYFINHPVNINEASVNELNSLPYMDPAVANIIIAHRNTYGNFFSVYELYTATGIPHDLVKKLLPFITVQNNHSLDSNSRQNNFSLNMRNRVKYDLQQRKGFAANKYLGSSYKFYNGLTAKYGKNITAGFLTEKDPGERRFNDFYSGYLQIEKWYNFENVILGDYVVEFGQGLALWSPFGLRKCSDAILPTKEKSRGIVPYKSTIENRFFRGAAIDYKWEHIGMAGFISGNLLDASIDSGTGEILSTPTDGFHRTSNELSKKNRAKEIVYGLITDYEIPSILNIGLLFYSSKLNYPSFSSSKFNIIDTKLKYLSSYMNLYTLSYNIFGEFSFNNKSLAALVGIKLSPSPDFTYSCLIRNYPTEYVNNHGFGFGEHSGALHNEFGIYNGFKWRTEFVTLDFYYDLFNFPDASSGIPLPSEGNEFMVNITSKAFNQIVINSRLRIENKESPAMLFEQDQLVKRLKKSFRFDIVYSFSKNLRIKTRFEYSSLFMRGTDHSEEGYLIFEDLRIQPNSNIVIYSRLIFFKTDSFNSAIYEYENDVAGIINNVGLYREGLRLYLILRYKLLDAMNISLKYSETYQPAETVLGTGYQEIDGNVDNNLTLQFDLTL